ncbi:HDOD domain protein [Planctomycetes bacterium Pla163]|uniref:HDOD domain protein n=1 Tax=Rohdeia mirabilis TaxID=2528008 RepID=A0A518D1W8_9BACT|nr:HDOD domain protein [Planctomycetes bacterium Pla163]
MSLDPTLSRAVARALRRAKNLPSPPAVVVRVLELTSDENSRIEDLAQAIGQDPTLASRLMRLANSALYGVQFKITEIEQAAMLMGMRNLKQLCIGLSLTGGMSDPDEPVEGYAMSVYWQHCLVSSVAAREIARRVGSGLTSEAFLCGLLARIGQLLMARCLKDAYLPVLDQAKVRRSESELPSAEIENALLGFHYGRFGAAVLRSWGLPDPIPHVIELAPDLRNSEDIENADVRDLVLFTHIGESAAGVLVESNKGTALSHLRAVCSDRLGLGPAEVDAFLLDLEGHVEEAARTLGQRSPDGPSFAVRLEQARDQLLASRGIAPNHPPRPHRPGAAGPDAGPAVRASAESSNELATREQFAERLAVLVRLRLEGFDHMCLGVLLVDVGQLVDMDVEQAAQLLRRNVRNSDMCARIDDTVLAIVAPSTTPQALRLLGMRLGNVLTKDGGTADQLLVGGVCVRHFGDPTDHELLFREAVAALDAVRADGRGVEIRYHREVTRAA